jgi:hypothetical protein
MKELFCIHQELINLEKELIDNLKKNDKKEIINLHEKFDITNQEWREEILKNVGEAFVDRTVTKLLQNAARLEG